MKRREFLKVASLATVAVAAIPMLAQAEERRRGGGAAAAGVLVDEKSAEAKAVNYTTNHGSVKDKNLTIVRQGVSFDKQRCNNCSLFQGKAGDKQGGCTLFPNKQVSATGWCSSWNKKV